MKKIKKIFLFLCGVIFLPGTIIGVIYFLNQNGFFGVSEIEIVATNSIDQSQFLNPFIKELQEELSDIKGISLWDVNLAKLDQQMSHKEWINEVTVNRQWPSKLKIEIKVKEIKSMIFTSSGKIIPVVDEGELLPAVDLSQAPDAAIMRGENLKKQNELRKKVIKMIDEIPTTGAFSKKSISEIHFDDKEGLWVTLIRDGIKVKLGQEQIAQKSNRISQVLDYVDSRKIQARVIDANLNKKVVVRLRKDP